MKRVALFVPLVVFAILSLFLLKGLDRDPTELPSALVGKSFPSFTLPSLADNQRLLITGKYWQRIYEIELIERSTAKP